MPPEISETENPQIDKELIDRIVSSKVTPDDVTFLAAFFSKETNKIVRTALIQSLTTELTPNALHAFNKVVMENANAWVPKDDSKFMGRNTKSTLFNELLRLEAKNTGFKLDVDVDEKGEFTYKFTIPSEILDHYATLKEGFYQQRGTVNVTQAIAESIAFLLAKDVLKETNIHKELTMKATGNQEAIVTLLNLEQQFAIVRGGTLGEAVKELINTNILNQVQHQPAQNPPTLSSAKVDKASSAIVTNMAELISVTIIDKSLKSLEQKGLSANDNQKEKIQKLTESVKNIPIEVLTTKQQEITAYLSKELESGRTIGSRLKSIGSEDKQYAISTDKITNIAQKLHDKFVEPQQTRGARIRRWFLRAFKPNRVGIIDSDLKSASTSVNSSTNSLSQEELTKKITQELNKKIALRSGDAIDQSTTARSVPPPLPPRAPKGQTAAR